MFYSSSACIYPEHNQRDANNPNCSEDSAYPAAPDSEYGWKSSSVNACIWRMLVITVCRSELPGSTISSVRRARGQGREKSPAAICRKVAQAKDGTEIEIWGDGQQTRSFLYIDECLEGVSRLVESDFSGPVNIGSEEMVTIDELAKMVMTIAGKILTLYHIPGPLGCAVGGPTTG